MSEIKLDAKIPPGPLAEKWEYYRSHSKLVNPANKRKYNVIVVGSGLAGASCAATLGELGYNVDCSRQSASRTLDCGPRRNQRRKELSE